MVEVAEDKKGHTLIGFANPFLICMEQRCRKSVKYWHDGKRCGCDKKYWNSPCNHNYDVRSLCPTWNPVNGCTCASPVEAHVLKRSTNEHTG